MKNKVFVFGIDGLGFDMFQPVLDEGLIPNFKKLLAASYSNTMYSTYPPITAPAWVALGTGLTPAQTGYLDFFSFNLEELKVTNVSSDIYKNVSIWDRLSKIGKKPLIFNYPFTYPINKINGIMVPGMGCKYPIEIFPDSLNEKYKSEISKLPSEVLYTAQKYRNPEIFFNDIIKYFDNRIDLFKKLLTEDDFDFIFQVVSSLDWIFHYGGTYMDKNSKNFWKFPSKEYKSLYIKFWQKLDEYLGYVLEFCDKNDYSLFIVSDHGSAELQGFFNINNFLKKKGYLKIPFTHRVGFYFSKIRNRYYKLILKIFNSNSNYYKKVKQKLDEIHQTLNTLYNIIDIKNSKAFGLGYSNIFGGVHINNSLDSSVDEIREELESSLKKYFLETDLDIRIERRENIPGTGREASLPDLIITVNDSQIFIEEQFKFRKILTMRKGNTIVKGSHNSKGIFIAYGSNISKSENYDKVSIYDFIPTITFMIGLPIPKNLQGEVLKEIFIEQIRKNEIEYSEPISIIKVQEHENIRDRLEGLGYF